MRGRRIAPPRPPADAVFDEFVRQCTPAALVYTAPRDTASAIQAAPPAAPVQVRSTSAPATQPHVTAQAVGPTRNRRRELPPLALTRDEVAALLTLSARTVQNMVARGELPQPKRISRNRVVWLYEDVKRYLDGAPNSDLLPPPNSGWRGRR